MEWGLKAYSAHWGHSSSICPKGSASPHPAWLVAGQAALTAGAAESAGWTEKSSGKQPVRGSGGTRPTGAPTAPAVSVVPCGCPPEGRAA